PVFRGDRQQVAGLVAISYFLPEGLATKVYDIKEAFEEYKQKKIFKAPIKAQYVVLFLMFTLLIVFSATWFGFYLAKGITVPIQELVEGTRAIAGGKLDFTISARADDEIGMLVDSFNKMTADLHRSQQELERTNADLRQTNVELDQRRSYMETVLENITTGVLSLDPKGRITTFNRAAERILGIDAASAKGRHYRTVFRSDHMDPVRALMKKMNENGATSTTAQMQLSSGGRKITLITSVTHLQDREGNFLGMVIVFDDLSELIKAQRTAAWQEVARGIAHEIKNPLTPIQLSTQRLRKKLVEVIKGMVDEFSKFARMPLPNPKPNNLHQIIEDATGLYRTSVRKIEITSSYDPNVPVMELDREQMQRVFINLLENSVDATQGKGRIEIRTSLDAQRQRVSIEVSDDGVGIPAEDRDKLFAPYFSTKKRGTGLGLAIVQRIVADHNGTVYVQDNKPRGTKFVIELPLGPHKAQASKKIISV
ncbi:MAG: PAS domain S-box protein, partial [Candidatus Tectomicrobia bacterium]|nr:PAS domain S-box protein [Candidatus Tectomicrobia bacterium]